MFFLTCFIALLIYRILEKKINIDGNHFTTNEIIETLQSYNLLSLKDIYYLPTFTRTKLTDILEQSFSISLSRESYTNTSVNKIIRSSKK